MGTGEAAGVIVAKGAVTGDIGVTRVTAGVAGPGVGA